MTDFKFKKELSPLGAWAFSFGCLLGWGSLVMTGTEFLPAGGVAGSLLGFLAGGIAVAAIAMNYHYLASLCPGRGGIFYLLQNILNREHAFAASWAMCFAHLVIIPLNARALAELIKVVAAEYLNIHFHITLFNSHLLVVDFIVIILVLLLFAWINTKGIRLTGIIQSVLAVILLAGITTLFIMSMLSGVPVAEKLKPSFAPGQQPLIAVLIVFAMIPWAFVGFDSVPLLSREIRVSVKKIWLVMILAVAAGTFGYMANIVITVMGVSPTFTDWVDYTEHIDSFTGLDSIAVVGSVRTMFGTPGVIIAFVTLLAGVLSGPNGTIAVVSRQVYCMSRSNSLFPALSKTNSRGVPYRAINFVMIIAVGMTLVSTTFNTMETIASIFTAFGYGYCSAAALQKAVLHKKKLYIFTGAFGLLVCLVWFVLLLIPFPGFGNTFTDVGYACLAIWVFIGIWGYAITCRKPNTFLEE